MKGAAASTIAACFALSAFTVAIVAGLAAKNPAASVLFRAVIALLICYPIGLGIGMILQRVVRQHVDAHRIANPAPASDQAGASPAENVDEFGQPTDEEVIVA